jgi:heparin/heparan-sulfate lyase
MSKLFVGGSIVGVLFVAAAAFAAEVKPEHPRMLLSKEDLPAIRERCQTSMKESFDALKQYADSRLTAMPTQRPQGATAVLIQGFMYQVTGDEKYAKASIPALRDFVTYHLGKVKGGGPGSGGGGAANWETTALRRDNYVAYDWLYNAMAPEEREAIGRMLLEIADIHKERETWNPAYAGGYNRFENDLYCGLALAKSGIDDAKAEAYVKSGFDFMMNQTIAGRNQVATDDGGIQSGMGYSLYNYIPVEAYFLSLWKSATGEDLFEKDASLRYFPVWALYCITPNFEYAPICDIGVTTSVLTADTLKGNTSVSRNGLRLLSALIANRYRDPRAAALMPEPGNYWVNSAPEFILWSDPTIKPVPPGPELPHGRHFEGMGWVALRSGWDPDATYSIFVCGDYYYGHRHYDVNHFVIYKSGDLAADARERIYDTKAHNTLLVFTGPDSEGGQRRPTGDSMVNYKNPIDRTCDMGDITAFETNDHYVYVSGDGAKAYNWVYEGDYVRGDMKYEPQLESFTRQYVYLLPNTFVVFDRAVGVKPEYRKVWQLHTWEEPKVEGATIVAGQDQGRLTCISLLPEQPVIKKQYQELTGSENTKAALWQTTVERATPAKEEQFLHVIHVGAGEGYQAPQVKKLSDGDAVGAEVTADGLTYTVTFKTAGPVAGHVRVKKGAETLIDTDLTTTVQPQAGYAAK